ncbi:hypothetical protein Hdeb2414_s0004g00131061 [Helianthus debilis subsp. tardiflorus]
MVGAALDMSLNDLIKNNKKSGDSGGRDRGPASGPGPAHRFNNHDFNRSTPYGTTKASDTAHAAWNHDMLGGVDLSFGPGGRASRIETGTRLLLDCGLGMRVVRWERWVVVASGWWSGGCSGG